MSKHRLTIGVVVLLTAAVVVWGFRRFSDASRARGRYNVLLITLDTTRADHLGCYGYPMAMTPALDGLSRRGVTFDKAVSAAPMTLPSHTTMHTGFYPPEHGIRINGEQEYDRDTPTLAEVLKREGYQTGAFVASFTLNARNGLNRGFDVYDDDQGEAYEHHKDEPLSSYRPGNLVTDAALDWLQSRDDDRPFFCWAHYFDPHTDHHAHDELAGTPYAGQATYDAEIAFMDLQVGRLLSFLEEEGLSENTLVIAVGDHGEGLGEHGEPAHAYMLYNSTLHVPMIFSLPGTIRERAHVDSLVSLVDLFATVVDFLGIESVEDADRSGRSLAAALNGFEIDSQSYYAETNLPFTTYNWSYLRSLTTPRWKYIYSRKRHLFDLQADPRELNDLIDARPEVVAQMHKQLGEIENGMSRHTAGQVALTAAMQSNLGSLGYISSSTKNLDAEDVDISQLPDIEDMLDVIKLTPTVRSLGREEKYDEQIKLLRQMVERSPGTKRFRRELGGALANAGQDAEALTHLLAYLESAPDETATLNMTAVIYHRLGNDEEAVRYFTRAMKSAPQSRQPHLALAEMLRSHGDPDGAARQEAAENDLPPEANAEYVVGVILMGEEKYDRAIEAFQKVLKLAPEDPLTHHVLAKSLELSGDFDAAARHYAKALELDPDDPNRSLRLGTLLGKQKKYAESIKYLRQCLELDPANASARNNLAIAMAKLNNPKEAIEQLTELLEDNPEDALAHRNLADLLMDSGDVPGAARHYAEAVRLKSEDQLALKGLGMTLARQGKFQEAYDTFTRVTELDPTDGRAWFGKGSMLEAQKKPKEAAAVYRKGLQSSPDDPLLLNAVAWHLATFYEAEARNGAEAVRLASAACKVTENKDPALLDTLAAAQAEAGLFDQAVETARKAAELASAAENEPFAKAIRERLELYESHKPYHQAGPKPEK